ncbi:DHH family phosphoesterase [Streptococcus sp. zg-JUN1979]|uniref:DHH family phosphoesterase n=1 Tax=Streptococcus sp. zg-JUN1979 TaxID=3391450 RepID=UPI0039A4D76F
MKRFRFATIHLVLIGLILFGILAICVRLLQSQVVLLAVIFIEIASVTALLYYQKETYELSELEQIELLNDQTEVTLKTLLDKMPVGVIQFDLDTNEVEWFNPYAELIFTDEEGVFDDAALKEIIISKRDGAASQAFEKGGNKYAAYLDVKAGVFYFFDSSMGNRQLADSELLRPVIGIISVDNYDDMTGNLSDAEVASINSFIASFISDFAKTRDIFYRRVNMDRFYFFTNYAILKELMDTKFEVLDQFRRQTAEHDFPLTLSMGISFGDGSHSQIGQVALQNLNMAMVRGGDQIVIRENDDHSPAKFFGGSSVSTVKRSRTRTRAMMSAISDRLKMVDKVFIVGHRNLDLDALGASVGMQFFASNIIESAYVVYNPDEMQSDIERAIYYLIDDKKTKLVTIQQAMQMVTPHSILLMVDHSKISLTLSQELYQQFHEVIVVDHHRRDEDFPKNATLSFIESGASSASELVTELIQFQQAKETLSRTQASILMSGIMLDTKHFSSGVTSRTFDVASYLRSCGSDSSEIQEISATDFSEYRAVNELVLRGEHVAQGIIIATGDEARIYNNVTASKAADTLLSMAGVEASFVITHNSAGNVAISARSHQNLNVQRIMEKLGGGGHFNFAACHLVDTSVNDAKVQLLAIIKEELAEQSVIEEELS